MNARIYPVAKRLIVTLFPCSVAPGLNLIAYGLMPDRLPEGTTFGLWDRSFRRAKVTLRPRHALS